jgi:hypothetical protein
VSQNGRLPDSELAAIPGGRLRKDAAAAWNAMRSYIGEKEGVWIVPTSRRCAYRPIADQQYFWDHQPPLAARVGYSNHGWGIAVDLPTEAMKAAVRRHGHKFGWGIRGGKLSSDAPSEDWHCTFHTGVYHAPAHHHTHPYHYMTDAEQYHRDVLVRERRIARRHGGWEKVDGSHLRKAKDAKDWLRVQRRQILEAGDQSKQHRKVRADYIRKLLEG